MCVNLIRTSDSDVLHRKFKVTKGDKMKYQKLLLIVLAAALLGACSSNKMGKMKMASQEIQRNVVAAA